MSSRLLMIAVAAASMLAAAPRIAEAKTISYSVVIGNNAPPVAGTDEVLGSLRYADDDALRYYQLFSRVGTARLLTVLDKTTQRRYPGAASTADIPTIANLRATVDELARSMARDRERGDKPVFYFVFSGHGARDRSGNAFLALADGALTQDILYDEVVARLPVAYAHLIIDACHAGGVVGVRGGFFDDEKEARTAPVEPDEVLALTEGGRLSQHPQVGVFLSTTLGQEAHEWSAIESGVFTHELLSGLLGPADVNGDLRVEYTEAQAFVSAANRNIVDPRAIPHVIAKPPQANVNAPLISLDGLRGARLIRGVVGELGHFFVELDNGQRYLDAHLPAGAVATILAPIGGAFVRTDRQEARLPPSKASSFRELEMRRRSVAARGSIDSTYRRALFSASYGADYYQGFVDSIGAVGVQFQDAPGVATNSPTDSGGNKAVAVGAFVVGGALLATSAVTTALAFRAKADYEDTNLQRPAAEARDRYRRYRTAAIATGITAVAAGLLGYWMWPDSDTGMAASISADGDAAVFVEHRW